MPVIISIIFFYDMSIYKAKTQKFYSNSPNKGCKFAIKCIIIKT